MTPPRFRIGNGFDVHAFATGRALVVGGVTIPHERGLDGHSDADVLLHAIADALLGALALGDIGMHFPDSDPQWRGADSRSLLRHVVTLVDARGYVAANVDATLIAQAPRFAPYVEAMRRNIALDVGCEIDCVSVKATTTERLGFTGRGEGIAAQAVVLLAATDSAAVAVARLTSCGRRTNACRAIRSSACARLRRAGGRASHPGCRPCARDWTCPE